jgi:tripartite-type tricarboxylate transporter receptor subunit TctC
MAANRPPIYRRKAACRKFGEFCSRRLAECNIQFTIAEAGQAGYAPTTWTGLLAPANTPSEIFTRLRVAVVKSLRTSQARAPCACARDYGR